LDRVFFKTSKARILRRSYPLLDNVAAVLINHLEIKMIEVQGHTDDRGDDAKNQALSQRRADAVLKYLVRKGKVDASRLRATGFGESKPVEDNANAEGREANRRVEFVIVGGSESVREN
ncbi:MAG: OmpA family protein, partial [Kofleriaceae bacterium]|nr:OmpA family protein [Kofleriaceae bacterium]